MFDEINNKQIGKYTSDLEAIFSTLTNNKNGIHVTPMYGLARLWLEDKAITAYVVYKNSCCFENEKGETFYDWNNAEQILRNYMKSEKFKDDFFGCGCVLEFVEKYFDTMEINPIYGENYKNVTEAEKALTFFSDIDEERGYFCCNFAEVLDDVDVKWNYQKARDEYLASDEYKKYLLEKTKRKTENAHKSCQKAIKIRCKNTNEVFEFDSYKECMEYLCMKSNHTFSAFLKGDSKYNKIYEIIS